VTHESTMRHIRPILHTFPQRIVGLLQSGEHSYPYHHHCDTTIEGVMNRHHRTHHHLAQIAFAIIAGVGIVEALYIAYELGQWIK
jgi:hypothetical protein